MSLMWPIPKMQAVYSKLHKKWVVQDPERHELIIGSGSSAGEAEYKARKKLELRWASPTDQGGLS